MTPIDGGADVVDGGGEGARRPRGTLEAAVLEVLWASGTPMTPSEVQVAVGGDLAYTTVQTILTRLHEKGSLRRSRAGRAHAYEPVSDEPGLAARRMRRVLDQRLDRDTVLARFVDDLSDDDEQLLRRLLGE
ncbi:BlaI/MecI/CopY family transcriptional regulator [Actinomycetospora sp. CA-053990]|uniref:BlaI/MecI/CopY family transcriptional regulator n=1 Tax=Actinomycetospora sp. CA-053990 TaxID=3239891 RepID=UPI003D90074E